MYHTVGLHSLVGLAGVYCIVRHGDRTATRDEVLTPSRCHLLLDFALCDRLDPDAPTLTHA